MGDAPHRMEEDLYDPVGQEYLVLECVLRDGSVGHNGGAVQINSMTLSVYRGTRASEPNPYRAHVEMRVSGNVAEETLRETLPALCTRILSVGGGFYFSREQPRYQPDQRDVERASVSC